MPKVQLLVNVGLDGVMHQKGATLDVDKETAQDWRSRRMATPLGVAAPPEPPPPAQPASTDPDAQVTKPKHGKGAE